MIEAGRKLRNLRLRLGLKFRDVKRYSEAIAAANNNSEFQIGLSRLSEIENGNVAPTFYRLYSLAAIYKIDFLEVLRWYRVPLERFTADALQTPAPSSSLAELNLVTTSLVPRERVDGIPALAIHSEPNRTRYAVIGSNDYFMAPLIPPGAVVQVDTRQQRVIAAPPSSAGWGSERRRPLYLVDTREALRCCWCSLERDVLWLLPHPASRNVPEHYKHREQAEIVGRVIAATVRLGPETARHAHSGASPE